MDLQNLLKQWKSNPKGKNTKDYHDFLEKSTQFQELMFTNSFSLNLMLAEYKLLFSHLTVMKEDQEYVIKFIDFIQICLKFNNQVETLNFLKDSMGIIENSLCITSKVMEKISSMSKFALESSDFQALNVLWKTILKFIARDIPLDLKHFLFKNAFMEQLEYLLKNKDLDPKKYYGLIAFYLGHLNAFVKFSTTVLVGEEDLIIGFLVSTGENIFDSLDLNVENGKMETLLVGLQCIVSCFMQQPALQDFQKVLLVNKIIQGKCANPNVLKSRLYLSTFIMKTFERLDIHAQVELINPTKGENVGICEFIISGVAELKLEHLQKPIWSKNCLNDQIIVCFGIMVHGLHYAGLQSLVIKLLENFILSSDEKSEHLMLDIFQIIFEIDSTKSLSEGIFNDIMFLLERISTNSNVFKKLSMIISRIDIYTFESLWMDYPNWNSISDSQFNRCLLLWSTPLCSYAPTNKVIAHLDSIRKVWHLICSVVDQSKDTKEIDGYYHLLGLICDCYVAIFKSRHIAERNVRLVMNSVSQEISSIILPLVNGGVQSLESSINSSMGGSILTAKTLNSIFCLIPHVIDYIKPPTLYNVFDICIRWIENQRIKALYPIKGVLIILEAASSRPSDINPDRLYSIAERMIKVPFDWKDQELALIHQALTKIYPNLMESNITRINTDKRHSGKNLVPLKSLKRNFGLSSPVPGDSLVLVLACNLDLSQNIDTEIQQRRYIRYLQTAILSSQKDR